MGVSSRRPHVLWIGVDQMRYDTLGANGNGVCRTPNLDRLASRGVRFDNAYSPSSLCTPARASMLTGRYAFTHGMGTNCDMYHALAAEMPDPSLFLHTLLKDAGYRLGFVGKWHVGTRKGPADYGFEGMSIPGYGNIRADRGFNRYLAERGYTYRINGTMYGNPDGNTLLGGLWDGPTESTPSHYLAEYTKGMIDELSEGEEPFFLTCQFWGPHMPHVPSREYYGMHDRSRIPPWENYAESLSRKPEYVKRTRRDFYRTPPEDWSEWAELVGLYYDTTAMVDAAIGRIIDHLHERGLADDTIIVFTSDHGDMTGSHGGSLDKGFMYEEAHRIPLVFSWPGELPSGRSSTELASNMDIFPTILELLGFEVPRLDGISLVPALNGTAAGPLREEFLLEFHGLRFLYSQRGLVRRDGWKYVFSPGDWDEVYDLNRDPHELDNRVDDPSSAAEVADLRVRLETATTRAGDPLQDCVAKYFGNWENRSGQPDATRMYS